MAAYEAIRDSFREFNRTLIDSQKWNAEHESRMADQQLKEKMLMNQLNQQTFSNRMENERLRIAKGANQTAAERLRQQILNDQRNFDSDQAQHAARIALERDKLNNTIKDQGLRRTAKTKLDAEAIKESQLRQTEQEAKNKQTLMKLKLLEESTKPTTVTIPPKYQSNPAVMDELKDLVLMQWDGSITDDGVVTDKYGKAVEVPLHEYRSLKFRADAIMAANDDKPKRVLAESAVLANNILNKKASLTNMKSTYKAHEAAQVKRDINLMESELENRKKFLEGLNTHQGKAKYLREQAAQLRIAAGDLSDPNKGNDPDTAKQYIAIADVKEAAATALLTGSKGNAGANLVVKPVSKNGKVVGAAAYNKQTGTWNFRGKEYRSPEDFPEGYGLKQDKETSDRDKTLVTRTDKLFKTAISPSESMWDSMSGDTKNAINTLKGLVFNDAKERGIDLTTEQAYQNLILENKATLIEAHNKLAALYQKERENKRPNDFDTWVKEVYRPKLRKLGFEYDPKLDYREQIGQSD